MDLLQREGHYPVPPGASKILGVEFSGTIAELSEEGGGKEGFKEGDEVFGLAYGGAYAEYIAVSTHMLVRKPKELSWEQCAGIPEVMSYNLAAMILELMNMARLGSQPHKPCISLGTMPLASPYSGTLPLPRCQSLASNYLSPTPLPLSMRQRDKTRSASSLSRNLERLRPSIPRVKTGSRRS